MRVAHVTSYRPGSANGVSAAAAELSVYLVQRGVEVEFWHFRRDVDRVTERTEPSGVRVVELPFPVLAGGASRGYLRRMPAVSRRWIEARESSLDGLHFHSVFQPESWYLSRRTTLPFCLSPHGGYTMLLRPSLKNHAKKLAWRACERRVVERAKVIHAVSRGEAETIGMLVPGAPVVIVPNGVRLPSGAPTTIIDGAPWLFIGRLDVWKKGLDLLVDGYALALRRVPLPTLIIRGPDFRGGRAELERRVKEHGLGGRIKIGGATADPEKENLLRSCALFVHPSRNEGLPIAPLEALAARPTRSCQRSHQPGRLRQGCRRWIRVGGATPESVAETLEIAARSNALELTAMGFRGRTLVEGEFAWAEISDRMVTAYEKSFRQPVATRLEPEGAR